MLLMEMMVLDEWDVGGESGMYVLTLVVMWVMMYGILSLLLFYECGMMRMIYDE